MIPFLQICFLALCDRALGAIWLVVFSVALRPVLKKLPARLRCWLWAAVGLRLVLPTFYVPWSAVPQPSLPAAINGRDVPRDATGLPAVSAPVESPSAAAQRSDLWRWAGVVWAIGVVILLLWALASALRLRRRLAEAVPMPGSKDLWQSAAVDTPFVFGLLRPRIYLPFTLNADALPYVVAHERAHIARRDHLTKAFAFVILAIWWFVPWLWLAWVLLGRDIEAACDERVLAGLDADGKKGYARALLECSAPRRALSFCPAAFGEADVKARIQNVLRYQRPAVWAMALGLVLVAVAVALLWPSRRPDAEVLFSRSYNAELVYQMPVFDSVAGFDRVTLSREYILTLRGESEQILFAPLTRVQLTEDSFDLCFFTTEWNDHVLRAKPYEGSWTFPQSPADLRRANYRTWRTLTLDGNGVLTAGAGTYYLILLQNDGTAYLAQGYTQTEGPPCLRALFLLTPVATAESEAPTSLPQEAGDRPAGGAWQFAETLYVNPQCSYLYSEGEGCWYIIGEGFSTVRDGDIVTTYPRGGLQWVDYSVEDWQALFPLPADEQQFPNPGADTVPRADIDAQDFLLAVGEDLWLVRGSADMEGIGPRAVLRLISAQ